MAACGGSNGGSGSTSGTAAKVQARFVEGAPELETIINGAPQDIGSAFLTVNGQTVASAFPYGTRTPFVPVSAGTLSLTALNSQGYAVGPIKTTTALTAGKSYTVALVGAYPSYHALVFEEPPPSTDARLSLYEASPTLPNADFGRFAASTNSNFKKLGSAHYASVVTVSLGTSVTNFGGYAGKGTTPFANGALTTASVDPFDTTNSLPFNNSGRFSLFVLDPKNGVGPVFATLDQ
ncbi:MAG: DUF4397 domain-containing protein [Candidatus Eremiobacteraeota bacterium]|nr:DUF4397 domain-containing protein [Candidatus Eremiobacteraeota bacterium]